MANDMNLTDTDASNASVSHASADNETMGDGSIPLCPHQGCAFKCCSFQQGNFIVLYPGELDTARAAGKGTDHLEVLEDYNGGHKVVCRASNTANCDNGYKPLDCASYPFFPTVDKDSGEIRGTLKGSKCPLTASIANFHRLWVENQWQELAERNPETRPWLSKVSLVGYETI